jgi:hypothetical protein
MSSLERHCLDYNNWIRNSATNSKIAASRTLYASDSIYENGSEPESEAEVEAVESDSESDSSGQNTGEDGGGSGGGGGGDTSAPTEPSSSTYPTQSTGAVDARDAPSSVSAVPGVPPAAAIDTLVLQPFAGSAELSDGTTASFYLWLKKQLGWYRALQSPPPTLQQQHVGGSGGDNSTTTTTTTTITATNAHGSSSSSRTTGHGRATAHKFSALQAQRLRNVVEAGYVLFSTHKNDCI